jgi:hypothetical protein
MAHLGTIWFRDDDFVAYDDKFRRLEDFVGRLGLRALCAVIPALTGAEDLARLGALGANFDFCVHGHSHRNHEGSNDAKSEYPGFRSDFEVSLEFQHGRESVRSGAGQHFLNVFVPPWNHIDRGKLRLLREAGFEYLSRYGEVRRAIEEGLRRIDAHVDVMNWRAAAIKSESEILAEICRAAGSTHNETGTVGLLTHHRAFRCEAYVTLTEVLRTLRDSGRWVLASPRDVFF